jgi:hypothetical protein
VATAGPRRARRHPAQGRCNIFRDKPPSSGIGPRARRNYPECEIAPQIRPGHRTLELPVRPVSIRRAGRRGATLAHRRARGRIEPSDSPCGVRAVRPAPGCSDRVGGRFSRAVPVEPRRMSCNSNGGAGTLKCPTRHLHSGDRSGLAGPVGSHTGFGMGREGKAARGSRHPEHAMRPVRALGSNGARGRSVRRRRSDLPSLPRVAR